MQLGRTRRQQAIAMPSRQTRALTAAGFRVKKKDSEQLRRLIQPWQTRAFAYYDLLGEINYAAQFYSRMLAPLRLFAAEMDDNGDIVETENEVVISEVERIQDPGGGRTGLLGSYGRLMFLAGESYLLCTFDQDTEMEQWEVLSTDELRVIGETIVRFKAPSLAAEDLKESDPDDYAPLDDETCVVYRLWRRHPRYSMLADSTMKGVLDLCEELVLLTRAVRARARSRAAGSGVLFIDGRISPAPLEPGPDDDPNEDPFVSALTEAMMAPIADEGAAEAIVPITVRVPVPDQRRVEDMVHHLQLVDPTQLYPETGLRYECIKRLAIGLDMPPEILLGLQDSNHWTAWQIDEQTWKGHGQPIAQQLCDDLTASFLRPTLKQNGVADWNRYCISYDASAIINHPDRTKDAKDLYDRRVIGKKALRTATGFDEEDAPNKNELAEMIGVQVRDSSLAWFGTPAPRGGAVETAPGQIEQAVPGTGESTGPTTGAEVETGPPSENGTTVEQPDVVGAAIQAQVARIVGACEMGLLRAREAAGNRLVSLAKRDAELRELVKSAPRGAVASKLGPGGVKKLGASEVALVQGGRDLVLDALRLWGVESSVAEQLALHVERHAARTLYDEMPSLPPNFNSYVVGLAGQGARAKR